MECSVPLRNISTLFVFKWVKILPRSIGLPQLHYIVLYPLTFPSAIYFIASQRIKQHGAQEGVGGGGGRAAMRGKRIVEHETDAEPSDLLMDSWRKTWRRLIRMENEVGPRALVEHSHCEVMGAIFSVNGLPKVRGPILNPSPWTIYNCSSTDSLLRHGLLIYLLILPPLLCSSRSTASSLKLEDKKNSLPAAAMGLGPHSKKKTPKSHAGSSSPVLLDHNSQRVQSGDCETLHLINIKVLVCINGRRD